MLWIREFPVELLMRSTRDVLDAVRDAFKYQPTGYQFAPSYERWKVSGGQDGWDGYLSPIRYVGAGMAAVPRGRKGDILAWAAENSIPVNTEQLFKNPFSHLTVDDVPADLIAGSFKLDDAQRACIHAWLVNAYGINHVSVSGGKTAIACGAVAFLKANLPHVRAIYLTQAERLVRQVTKEAHKFLPDLDIGQYGGGKQDKMAEDMVVCTTAMLSKNFNKLIEEGWFSRFNVIVYDECQHSGSESSKKILLQIPAWYRFGESDTLKEEDPKRWNEIRGLFGPVVNTIKTKALLTANRVAKPHVFIVDNKEWKNKFSNVPFSPQHGSKAYVLTGQHWQQGTYVGPVFQRDEKGNVIKRTVKGTELDEEGNWIPEEKLLTVPGVHSIQFDDEPAVEIESRFCLLERAYDRAIIRFKDRNDQITDWAAFYSQKGHQTIVVATRTTHILILESLIKKRLLHDKVDILLGEDSPAKRDKVFDWFRSTPGAVLITPLVKEGVSINEIKALIVADYVADYEFMRQIIGRAIRKKHSGDNEAFVTMFRENQHPTFSRSFNRMLSMIKKEDAFEIYDPAPSLSTLATR